MVIKFTVRTNTDKRKVHGTCHYGSHAVVATTIFFNKSRKGIQYLKGKLIVYKREIRSQMFTVFLL